MTTDYKPRVSIVITCYNYANYVEEAIGSVLTQTYDNIELIVIDDGSTDNSLEVIKQYENNDRVSIITRENKGIVYTRNEALSVAKGDYVIQLDADDYLDENYVEATLAYAIKYKSDIVYTNFKKFEAEMEVSDFPEYTLEELKNHNIIHMSSLVRKVAVGKVRFDEALSSSTHEDWDFFLSLGISGAKANLCKDTFLNYRIHQSGRNNIMQSTEERAQYTSVYSYIMKKHATAGDSGFDYLVGTIFADWYQMVVDDVRQLDGKCSELQAERNELQAELTAIKSSRSYRLSRRLARLKRQILG